MRFILSALLIAGAISLVAQDTLQITEVEVPPTLNETVIPRAKGGEDQNTLLLLGVYSTVKYPRYAREKGVRSAVGVKYLVDTSGAVVVEKAWALTQEEAAALFVPKDELVIITAFAERSVNGAPGVKVPPPTATKNPKRLAKAYAFLEAAAADAIASLPNFQPATHRGKPVAVSATRYFVFRLE